MSIDVLANAICRSLFECGERVVVDVVWSKNHQLFSDKLK
jgi:hypothetical protein